MKSKKFVNEDYGQILSVSFRYENMIVGHEFRTIIRLVISNCFIIKNQYKKKNSSTRLRQNFVSIFQV